MPRVSARSNKGMHRGRDDEYHYDDDVTKNTQTASSGKIQKLPPIANPETTLNMLIMVKQMLMMTPIMRRSTVALVERRRKILMKILIHMVIWFNVINATLGNI